MQREHHRNAALPGCKHEGRRQVVQVPDVDDVGFHLVQDQGEGVIHGLVPVAVPGPGHVDDVQRDFRLGRVNIPLQGVLGQKGILLPGEDVHLVPLRQRLRQSLGIHLRAGVVAHRVAVNYL